MVISLGEQQFILSQYHYRMKNGFTVAEEGKY